MDTNLTVSTGLRPIPPTANADDRGSTPTAVAQAQQGSRPPDPAQAEADDAKVSRLALAVVAVADHGRAPNVQETEEAVARLNEILRDRRRELEFSVDQDTGRTVLKVIHAESGEVIRQIPPEELLQIARTFIEGTGSFIEEQA